MIFNIAISNPFKNHTFQYAYRIHIYSEVYIVRLIVVMIAYSLFLRFYLVEDDGMRIVM
jgi:hypothetical protein